MRSDGDLLCMPVLNVMMGGELQWRRRENNLEGSHDD